MPGMRGDELVRAMHNEEPNTPAIFISGYADTGDLDKGVSILEKPFSFPDLGRRVQEILSPEKRAMRPETRLAS